MTNSYYAELQSQKREKVDYTQMEEQTNNKEPTLDDIMSSLCNITDSIKGIEQRLEKLEVTSNKVDELETKHNTLEKRFKEVESAQDFICNKLDEQEKQIFTKRKQSTQQNDKAIG